MTHILSFYSGNIPHKLTKKLGTMMPCMTHVISSYCGKSHINNPKKLGVMMPCMTHVISFYELWKIPQKWPQKRSVPWCCKSHMWQYFTSEKCLQTFATELDAVMCLMSKTEKFDFRTIKCHWAALVKKTLSLYGHNLGVARMVRKQLYCCSERHNQLNANTVVTVLCSRIVYTCVKASVGKSVCV